ncbi:MAG: T9SS type A sorting domain-containing protein [Polaribacter sp.]|jgi:hypothetical protein
MKKQFLYLSTLFIIFSMSICAQQDQDTAVQKKENKDITDEVIAGDLIVQKSIAVGLDAVDGEAFGFDTFRLKENNIRIHFDDTSGSGSFPDNDWRIVINDAANGGANYFGIEDATADVMSFKILAGAPANAFFMAANGNIGLGSDAPVVKLHIADGNSPALRIEQDASDGWTPQSWDVSGNESNFFIRDNTNGSTLPFRIKPGAPENALFIAANGNIGLGTATPNANASLELKSANKGFLLNRLTTAEKTTLQSLLVAEDIGLMVYDTDIKGLFSWDGTQWISVVNTDAQDLALTTNTLSLTNDGTAVDLSGYLDNTDAQDLSLSTNTLSLTNDGTTVDLSGYLDNIDAQTVSLTGTTLAISNGNTLDLSSLQDGIGTDAQDLILSTNTLSLTNDGTPVDLSGYLDNTDAQTVSLTGTTLAISNGNNLDLSSLQDGIGTDAQDLTSAVLSGNLLEIEIENGNSVSVDLSPVLSSLQAEINTQSEMITALVTRIEAIEACACGGTLAIEGIQNKSSNFKLSQNKPNPFNGETKIDFKIPSDIQKAYIKIYDSNGKTLQKIAITQRGEGSITYDNDRFSSGLYYYSLFADNIKVDTKKMLLNNK